MSAISFDVPPASAAKPLVDVAMQQSLQQLPQLGRKTVGQLHVLRQPKTDVSPNRSQSTRETDTNRIQSTTGVSEKNNSAKPNKKKTILLDQVFRAL